MTTTRLIQETQVCRLCYSRNTETDTVDIYGEKGKERDYLSKINRYLYLKVNDNDDYPKTICWMCSSQLNTFHKFYEKINQIQKSVLKDEYEKNILVPHFESSLDNVSSSEIEIFEEGCDEDTVEVVVLNTDDNYEDIDQQYEIEIHDDGQTASDTEKEEEIENKVVLRNVIKREKSIVHCTNRQTRSTKPKSTIARTSKAEQTESNEEFTDVILKQEEECEETPSGSIEDIKDVVYYDVDDTAESDESPPSKKRRGRPKVIKTENLTPDEDVELPVRRYTRQKPTVQRKVSDLPLRDADEGESGDEFPARDSDNEDWPAQTTLDDFPNKIIENGLLLVKGKKLMSMICKYYKLECDLCEQKTRFKYLRELFNHYQDDHKEDGYVTCCQSKFYRYPAIIMHMARHIQPDAFKCHICGYMVTRPRFLQSHIQTHLPEDQKPYACDECPKRFVWKGALLIHKIQHQPREERKLYVCHVCGKVYDTPGGLSTHKKLIHSAKKPSSNVCHVCAKKFATRTGLNEHMATIHQPREKDQLQCPDCGKWLMNQRCLKSHMILHSDTVLKCNKCEYTTKKHVLLNRHLVTQHSDVKPFKCDQCDRSFKLKRALTVHISQHTSQQKTFKCTFCDRTFNSSTNFYTHRKNIHPKELQALKDRKMELQRQKRIKAGIEEPDSYEVIEMADESLESPGHHITIRASDTQEEYVISTDDSSGIRILDASQIDERTLTKLISGDYETMDEENISNEVDPLVLNIEIDESGQSKVNVKLN
ncbi:Transcription factor grauzone [Pseudolycoriella hygida]|uniref:Transcription factor grauzone n=1 Tax=Pseudolycoriella hygida TaxID=35572 RepID=A0A9Q0MVX4_9DIPT|nr:Transcription factor grauzone [Pseudolycoriella hygida]